MTEEDKYSTVLPKTPETSKYVIPSRRGESGTGSPAGLGPRPSPVPRPGSKTGVKLAEVQDEPQVGPEAPEEAPLPASEEDGRPAEVSAQANGRKQESVETAKAAAEKPVQKLAPPSDARKLSPSQVQQDRLARLFINSLLRLVVYRCSHSFASLFSHVCLLWILSIAQRRLIQQCGLR